MVPGRDTYAKQQLSILLEAYETMFPFDHSTLKLIEGLRALRFVHFSAWIGKRWEDPAFQRAFHFYGSHRYWQEQLQDLTEQLQLLSNSSTNRFL